MASTHLSLSYVPLRRSCMTHHVTDDYYQDAGVAAPCGLTLSITDTSTAKTITSVPVVSTFVNCDSATCAPNAVRVSDAAATALGFPSSYISFPASWSFA